MLANAHSAVALPRSPAMLQPSNAARNAIFCAARDAEEEERRQRMMDLLYQGSPQERYVLDERTALLGSVDSHELLERDAEAGITSELLSSSADAAQMVFVDEFRCIGCKNCVEVSRSTFAMTDQGTARSYQQGADERFVIEEAIDCCPVDCIHWTSQAELKTLETFRAQTFEERWAVWQTRRLVARGEGRDGTPDWREPLE